MVRKAEVGAMIEAGQHREDVEETAVPPEHLYRSHMRCLWPIKHGVGCRISEQYTIVSRDSGVGQDGATEIKVSCLVKM